MNLNQRLETDMRSALKAGDSLRLSVLRMALSPIKMLAIEKNLKEVSDGEVVSILQRQIKQRRESISQFNKGNRPDLAEKETKELAILEAYMPKQLTDDELMEIVKLAISESGAVSRADMGKVMKLVMEKAKGKADGKIVNQFVMQFLK